MWMIHNVGCVRLPSGCVDPWIVSFVNLFFQSSLPTFLSFFECFFSLLCFPLSILPNEHTRIYLPISHFPLLSFGSEGKGVKLQGGRH